jgi:hypothetical protein
MKDFDEKQQKDAKRIADLEYVISVQVGLHRSEVQGLEKKLDEVTENFNVEQTKHEISDTERLRVQKNIEDLRRSKQECYNVAMKCCNKLKNSFAKLAHSLWSKILFVAILMGLFGGSAARPKLFDKILSDRGDFCAFGGAREAVSLLEKVGCKHAKAVVQPEFSVSANDVKNPSAEATALSGNLYSEVWLGGDREIVDEAIRKNEESQTALEEARKAKEAVELSHPDLRNKAGCVSYVRQRRTSHIMTKCMR